MDDFQRRKYHVDPLPASAITFRMPKELVDRNDVFVCVEYSALKKSKDNLFVAECQVWCRFKDADTAKMVCKDRVTVGGLVTGPGITDLILNGVLHSQKAVGAIQRFSGVKDIV